MTKKPGAQPRKAVSTKNLLWAIPAALAVIIVSAFLALPGFVSSDYHRATIEALASSLTGRSVHINGKLSLALLPHPQFIANGVTITSTAHETITAASLTLDIAPIPLLRGQISARAITLQSPHIALPWPLPGGAAAIAPPLWLTTLHAQINNGEVSLGAAHFTDVSADIFTGGQGTFSISGNGKLAGAPVILSLSSGALSAAGSTPLTLDIQTDNAARLQAHISGRFDAASTLTGNASFSAASLNWLDPSLSRPVTGTTTLTADPRQILLSSLSLRQGPARLTGSASISLPDPALRLLLTGENLTLPPGIIQASDGFPVLPVQLTLDASNTRIATQPAVTIAHLQTSLNFSASGTDIATFKADLPGAALSLSGRLDPAGNLQAKAGFDSSDLNLLAGQQAGALLPPVWAGTRLKFTLTGPAGHLMLDGLSGNFGPAKVTGTAILARQSLSGQLHFDQLDLTPLIALLRHPPSNFAASPWSSDFEITADRANIGKLPVTHLLVDARLDRQLIVRRLSASLDGGIAVAGFTLTEGPAAAGQAASAQITSARAILALPSAAPIAALLPAAFRPPAALTKAPLAFSILAAGPANALATSASLTLGDISITAAPVIDLIHQTASGAFTLRHPNAIAAFKAFGLNAGLAWPGAGSIALRANMILSPTRMGLSDFVLSMGDLTVNGALVYDSRMLNGEIDADTLALPPIPADFTPPWADLANIQGKIRLTANSVRVAGDPILGPTTGNITLSPGKIDLAVTQAAFAGGSITGDIVATLPAPLPPAMPGKPVNAPAPPALIAKFALTGADAAAVNLALAFPVTLSSGRLEAAIDLTASGYVPAVWLATLSGNASLAADAGSLNGFNLLGLASALQAQKGRAALLRAASLSGATPFTHLSLTSSITSGIATLTTASLQSPGGTATATGNIDLPDRGITATLTLLPAVPAPPKVTLTLDGNWTSPRKIPALKPALSWKPPIK